MPSGQPTAMPAEPSTPHPTTCPKDRDGPDSEHAHGPTDRGSPRQGRLEVHPGGTGLASCPPGEQLLQLARRRYRRRGAAPGGLGVGQAAVDRLRRGGGGQGDLHPARPRGARAGRGGCTGPARERDRSRQRGTGQRGTGQRCTGQRGRDHRLAVVGPPMTGGTVVGITPGDGTEVGGTMPGAADAPPFVVLGVSAGISAYKAVEVCRRLVDAGVHVAPVLTERATRFVGKATFDALGSEPTQIGLWDEASPIPHTRLGQRADLVVVSPATADLLARYAGGFADDLLTATLVATAAPVLVCPAMHTEMWEHPAVQENLDTLRRRGVTVIPPEGGRLAGGDVGTGRLADPSLIVATVLEMLGRGESVGAGDLDGVRMVVSAGGTREPIDPVRFITNRSSGKQGHALAAAARRRGAEVVLVTSSALPAAQGVEVDRVETAADMEAAMLHRAEAADVVVMAAAVADFRPKEAGTSKMHKSDGVPDLVLEATPDILAELGRRRRPGQVLVGFAAETEQLSDRARAKLASKGVDLMVANDVSAPAVGFDHDTNEVTIFGADGSMFPVALRTKDAVADAILDRVSALLSPS